ncbi:hypothetical protein Ndes2437A_g04212 [Nannochloris sp. 'desiccata']
MAKMRPTTRMLGLAIVLTAVVWLFPPRQQLLPRAAAANSIMCSSVGASLGLFLGDKATSLRPLDLLGVQGPAAWPVCNPIFTAGGLKSYDGIAGPSFFQYQGRLFMFFEALTCQNQRRSIGIAESNDEGITWRSLGTILSSKGQDLLRRPRVFTYNNEILMVTDSRQGPKLLRCLKFPMSWHLNATLTTEPLRGVSIFKAPVPEGVELAEEKWLMVGSLSTSSSSSSSYLLGRRGVTLISSNKEEYNGVDLPIEDDVIAVYGASSPLGPWKQYEQSPFRVHAASPGGGLTILPKEAITYRNNDDNNSKELIIRLGRSCSGGPSTCGDVVASIFDLSEDTLHEAPLSLPPHQNFLGERVWRQSEGWDGGERAEATVATLPSGKVAAIVLGKPMCKRTRPWYAFVLESTVLLLQMTVMGCVGCLVAMVILKNRGLRIVKASFFRGFGVSYGGVGRGGGGGGYAINRRGGAHITTSPNGINGNSSGGGSGGVGGGSASSLPGGYPIPKTSLAIQRLQAEERGEIHHQPISPRGRAVLTSRAAGRNGGGEGAVPSSAGAALAADLAARFAAFASMPPSSASKHGSVQPLSSPASPTMHHLSLNSSRNTHNHTTTASSLPNTNSNLRRRRQQIKLAIRGGIQRWAIRLLEATPRQMLSFLILSLAISSVAFAVQRVHILDIYGTMNNALLWEKSSSSGTNKIKNKKHEGKEKITSAPSMPRPPDPLRDFPWATVPIRVRAQANNSLTNRYLPDDQLRFRGVLSLDDDLRLPCADVERAFATWRSSPSSLTGYVARLAEVSTTPRYHTEPEAVAKGWYNLILTGAAFIDSRDAFAAYWSDSKPMQEARKLVDSLHNCDDILMNFVVANSTVTRIGKKGKKQGSVLFVRPLRRLDVSWLSGVGLSHSVDHFLDDAEQCLVEFEKLFGRWPLRGEEFNWEESEGQGGGKPRCRQGRSHLDCVYLS